MIVRGFFYCFRGLALLGMNPKESFMSKEKKSFWDTRLGKSFDKATSQEGVLATGAVAATTTLLVTAIALSQLSQ